MLTGPHRDQLKPSGQGLVKTVVTSALATYKNGNHGALGLKPPPHIKTGRRSVLTMVRKYLCSTCLNQHAPPTGRNCSSFKHRPVLPDIEGKSELESAFNSPAAKLLDKFLSTSSTGDMLEGEEGVDGGGAGQHSGQEASNSEFMQIIRIQQEQMKALYSAMAKMAKNISSLSWKF